VIAILFPGLAWIADGGDTILPGQPGRAKYRRLICGAFPGFNHYEYV